MTGPRIALALPAWKTSGSPAKISLACSGPVNKTSAVPFGMVRTVKTSPYLLCIAGTNRWRKRISATVCRSGGHCGPGGSSVARTCVRAVLPGVIFAKRSSVTVMVRRHIPARRFFSGSYGRRPCVGSSDGRTDEQPLELRLEPGRRLTERALADGVLVCAGVVGPEVSQPHSGCRDADHAQGTTAGDRAAHRPDVSDEAGAHLAAEGTEGVRQHLDARETPAHGVGDRLVPDRRAEDPADHVGRSGECEQCNRDADRRSEAGESDRASVGDRRDDDGPAVVVDP